MSFNSSGRNINRANKTYPCLYDKNKMSCKERDVHRNAEMQGVKLQKSWISYKTYTNVDMKNSVIAVYLQWQRIAEIHRNTFSEACIFFEINWATTVRRCSNCLGHIQKYLKKKGC